jgi:hypothetical protein
MSTPDTCPSCGQPHARVNTGPIGASAVALGTRRACGLLVPDFSDEGARRVKFLERGIKLTDFNDLQCVETSARVRDQVEAALRQLVGIGLCSARQPPAPGRGATSCARSNHSMKFASGSHSSTLTPARCLDRKEHLLMSLSDMRRCLRAPRHPPRLDGGSGSETSCESSKWGSTLVEAIRASHATCSADGPPRRRQESATGSRPAALPVQRRAQCRGALSMGAALDSTANPAPGRQDEDNPGGCTAARAPERTCSSKRSCASTESMAT